MARCAIPILLVWFFSPPLLRADTFDRYTEPLLAKVAESKGAVELKKLTSAEINQHGQGGAVFLVAKTNGGQWCKFLAQLARQKKGDGSLPIALLERGTTYKAGGDRVLAARFPSVRLFDGFLFNLDLGQVTPEALGGDLKFVADSGDGALVPQGQAKLYLITHHLPEVEPKKRDAEPVGEVFESRFLSGTYKLYDDGRRVATLTLRADDEGAVTGEYVSDNTGRKYEVTGKVEGARHHVTFSVKFPQSTQTFNGWSFTKDASAIAGSTRTQGQEYGFYAVRAED